MNQFIPSEIYQIPDIGTAGFHFPDFLITISLLITFLAFAEILTKVGRGVLLLHLGGV